jgi:hypothetical protein
VSYLFINRYCKLTANLPNLGIVAIIGWITQADEHSLLMLDENHNTYLIMREQMIGSIVVLMDQKEMPEVKEERVA